MNELGQALKALLDRIGVFLDLFDLSFFVSGAAALGAVAWSGYCHQPSFVVVLPNWVLVVTVILGAYIAGMVCFALGRWGRQKFAPAARPDFRGEQLVALLKLHGLEGRSPIKEYLARTPADPKLPLRKPAWALYTRIWAGIRHDPRLQPSLSVLNRYWVMAATYDGLAAALLLWGGVLGEVILFRSHWSGLLPWTGAAGTVLAFLGLAILCGREAGRYTMHQIGELAATLAAAQEAD